MNSIPLLLIDDEKGFLDTLSKRLAKRGFKPLAAHSGEAGLALLSEHPVPVVLLDVKMPGMSGLHVLARIKETYPQTEVILLTGHASTQDGIRGIKAGAFDYLTKPVELDHLILKITQAVETRQRAVEKEKEALFRQKINKQLTAAERLAALGTLATGVAHEINNPLAIIQESAGWMRSQVEKTSPDIPRKNDFSVVLDKIETAVDRARRITHQLLGMVQKDNGSIQEIDARGMADEILSLTRQKATEKGVALIPPSRAATGCFWSDPHRLRQILLNLLNNAIYATPDGGSVSLDIQKQTDGILFIIRDTGHGIHPESLEKIFEPFYTTKPAGDGTGLGLYISKRLVEKLGGKLEVESSLRHGTVIRLSLPVCPVLVDGIQPDTHQKEAKKE